jgi:hypothetical protein
MKTFNGIGPLIESSNDLPDVGWLFVDKNLDRTSKEKLKSCPIMLAETDEDESEGLKKFRNWLEAPTFVDILESRRDSKPNATVDEIIDAVIYYLENDTFIDDGYDKPSP